jgi:hypothetical protein
MWSKAAQLSLVVAVATVAGGDVIEYDSARDMEDDPELVRFAIVFMSEA